MALSCKQTRELFSLYLDQCLSESKVRAMEEHLRDCPGCAAELAIWKKLSRALLLVETPPAPNDLPEKVMARIEAEHPGIRGTEVKRRLHHSWLSSNWPRVTAAAAAMLIMAGGYLGLSARFLQAPPPAIIAQHSGTPSVQEPGQEQTPNSGADTPSQSDTSKPDQNSDSPSDRSEAAPHDTGSAKIAGKAPAQTQPDVKEQTSLKFKEPRVFLQKERQITSSFVKVRTADLIKAEQEARKAGNNTGALVQELARNQAPGQSQLGLKFTVDTARANSLLMDLTSLGPVLDRGSQTRDVTADFTANLELYSYWVKLRGTVSNPAEAQAVEEEINKLEKQLDAWDQEAEKQVIVLWLEETRNN